MFRDSDAMLDFDAGILFINEDAGVFYLRCREQRQGSSKLDRIV